jgi:DNA-binding CsgD family transcriptional regulator
MDENAFRGVKRACYAGLDSVTLRRTAAERAAPILHYDAYAFSTIDPGTNLLTHVLAEGIPDRVMASCIGELYPAGSVHSDDILARKGRCVSRADDVPARSSTARDTRGFRYRIDVVFGAGGALWGRWCIRRAKASAAADRRIDAFLRRVVPHLARGLQTAALLEYAHAVPDGTHDRSIPGVLVLDASDRPTLRTEAATVAFEDLADVGFRTSSHIPLAVRALVAQFRSRRAGISTCDSLPVHARGHSGKWYAVRATLAEPDALGGSAVVVVVQPVVPREMAPILARLYGLSTREREIVFAIAQGDSSKRIALTLGVSPYTVAEHINRACAKIGVRGRKALVARLFFNAGRTKTDPLAHRAGGSPSSLQSASPASLDDRPPSRDEPDQNDHDRDHEQKVDQPARDVKYAEAEEPQNEEDDR